MFSINLIQEKEVRTELIETHVGDDFDHMEV